MASAFHTKHHFKAPTSDGKVETETFLSASQEIICIIDYLGHSFLKFLFERVRSDISDKLTVLKNKHASNPSKYNTLDPILEDERRIHTSDATHALLWIKRTLELLYHISILLLEDNPRHVNMSSIALEAYGLSIKKYHNPIVQGLFSCVLYTLPSKKDFMVLLAGGDESKKNEVIYEIKEFTTNFKPNLDLINNLYKDIGKSEEK